jgi:hypothetical protein
MSLIQLSKPAKFLDLCRCCPLQRLGERSGGHIYKSASSSSGRGMEAASCISFWYCSSTAWSTWTSGGARAGAATNSWRVVSVSLSQVDAGSHTNVWLPTSFLASHRKGFSKL